MLDDLGLPKSQEIISYVERQAKLDMGGTMCDILGDMIKDPRPEAGTAHSPLHPGNYARFHTKAALKAMGGWMAAREGVRESADSLYERLELGIHHWMAQIDKAVNMLIEDPSNVRNLDFRRDHRGKEDEATRMMFREALHVRGIGHPKPEDHGLHKALNKLPFPKLEPDDVSKINRIIADFK